MIDARHNAHERADARLQAALRLRRRHLARWFLLTDEWREVWDQLAERGGRCAQVLGEPCRQGVELGLREREHLVDELARGPDERGVREVAPVEIELPGGEPAGDRRDRP